MPAFDGFRAFAIFGVVFLHLTQAAGLTAAGGEMTGRVMWGSLGRAVEVLFIVSGFVVFLPTVARRGTFGSIRSFAIRRGARLLPAYWMSLLVALALIAAFDPVSPQIEGAHVSFPGLDDILVNFAGASVPVAMFATGFPIGFGLNPPVWTLSVELGFYIALPLVAGAFFRWPKVALTLGALITIGWTLAFENLGEVTKVLQLSPDFNELIRLRFASGLQLPEWAYSFAAGMAGAVAWVRIRERWEPPRIERVAGPVALVALAVAAVTGWHLGGDFEQTRSSLLFSMIFTTTISVFMVALSLANPRFQFPFAARRVRQLGDISYGIYLSHLMIAVLVATWFSMPDDGGLVSLATWTAAVVPASVLYGYLSARFLEQPIRRWARRYGRRTGPAATK